MLTKNILSVAALTYSTMVFASTTTIICKNADINANRNAQDARIKLEEKAGSGRYWGDLIIPDALHGSKHILSCFGDRVKGEKISCIADTPKAEMTAGKLSAIVKDTYNFVWNHDQDPSLSIVTTRHQVYSGSSKVGDYDVIRIEPNGAVIHVANFKCGVAIQEFEGANPL